MWPPAERNKKKRPHNFLGDYTKKIGRKHPTVERLAKKPSQIGWSDFATAEKDSMDPSWVEWLAWAAFKVECTRPGKLTNVDPENHQFLEETHLSSHIWQGRTVNLLEGNGYI